MEKPKRIRLDELERKHPFTVPEGYFDSLAKEIEEKVERISSADDRPVVPLHQKAPSSFRWWRVPAVAASISLLAGLIWFTLPVRQGPLGPDALATVSDDAILEYLESQDLDYFDLASQDVVQKAFMDESTIIQYLDNVDDTTIREQLLENSIYDETI